MFFNNEAIFMTLVSQFTVSIAMKKSNYLNIEKSNKLNWHIKYFYAAIYLESYQQRDRLL